MNALKTIICHKQTEVKQSRESCWQSLMGANSSIAEEILWVSEVLAVLVHVSKTPNKGSEVLHMLLLLLLFRSQVYKLSKTHCLGDSMLSHQY